MFQNAVIDVAIGLILMYLMLSLLCTFINEYIATKLKIRATTLAATVQKLLDDSTLRDAFYKHGLIVGNANATATGAQTVVSAIGSGASTATAGVKSMVGMAAAAPGDAPKIDPKENHPSYLSGKTVALALIGSLNTSKPVPEFIDLKNAVVDKLGDSAIRDVLLSSLTEAQGSVDKLRTSIATWFDDSMERLSGAYKRKLQWISMVIGLIVAIAFNADSFKVGTTLWNDPARRAAIVEVAKVEVAKKAAEKPPGATKQEVNEPELRAAIENTESTLRSLPIGWQCPVKADASVQKPETAWRACIGKNWWETILQILGWLLTAAALSLGAPFWFDLLNKFINLRGAGAKPTRADGKTA